MSKKKIIDIIEEISEDFLAQNGLELYNCEFVKEGRDWFLRVYIDKTAETAEAAAAAEAEAAKASENAAAAAKETTNAAAAAAAETAENAPALSQYVSTDDCEKVSRFLSAELDRLDPIEQNYYLEVSSPGMDRALLKDKDFQRFSGEIVDVSLYKALDGKKTYQGRLLGIENEKIIITDEKDKRIEFPREQVAKTKLAIIF